MEYLECGNTENFEYIARTFYNENGNYKAKNKEELFLFVKKYVPSVKVLFMSI